MSHCAARVVLNSEEGGTMKAENIAAYIEETTGISNEWKLQKLVYYANAWALVWTGRPLVSDGFEAWRDSPVSRSLYMATHHDHPLLEKNRSLITKSTSLMPL